MPQDGSNNYQYPPGTPGVPDQTIESEAYNTFLDDLVNNDLNIPRPVHRGGTGANNAVDAMTTLGGELASQLVNNFDSHVWRPGSFRAPTSASGSPIAGHAFTGIAYSFDPLQVPALNQNIVIHARDWSDINKPGRIYIREKKAGVWDAWKGEDRIIVSSTPPNLANIPDGGLWWDTDNGILYISYNDGNSTAWVQVVAVPFVDTELFVKKEGDTMLGPLVLHGNAVAALDSVPKQQLDATAAAAAPLDALAYSGMQVNGGMDVNQQLGHGVVSGTTGTHIADQWVVHKLGAMAYGAATSNPGYFIDQGLPSNIYIAITTSVASLAANDYLFLFHDIEAWRVRRLMWGTANAKPITLAFWSGHTMPGLYSGTIFNVEGTRSYTFTYTHASSNLPQYNVITIPGPTDGNWISAINGVAIRISFAVAIGSALQAPTANTWLNNGSYRGALGQTNAAASTAWSCRFGGVVILPGIYAPTAAQSPLIMRPYDQELLTCQRYWQRLTGNTTFYSAAAGSYFTSSFLFRPVMRATPTLADDGNGTAILNVAAINWDTADATACRFLVTAGAIGVCQILGRTCRADARL